MDHVFLSRLQFAFTAMFHILWPVFTIGMSLLLFFMEAMWLKTRDDRYYHHARFWTKLFMLNLAVGVVSGIPMEFQFGTNWSKFSVAGGDLFGHLLGFEAAMAFMLEATFLGIMIFGWKRVRPGMHLFSTAMVALGASMSAFWILVANSWMQTPAGGNFRDGRFVIQNNFNAIFNPDMIWGVTHMWVACLEITIFVVGGISAWYIYKKRNAEFFLRSFKIVVVVAILVTPLQIYLGDSSGRSVFHTQPTKLAAIEGHWHTNPPGTGAPWSLVAWPDKEKQDNVFDIKIPYMLSILVTHSLTGQVKGLTDFPVDEQPPVILPYYSFRIMAGIGFLLFFLMLWTCWAWRKGKLNTAEVTRQKWLLYSWMAALPLSYIALEAGWVTREVGRQPWIIYGVLRTQESASNLTASAVGTSLLVFFAIYFVLFVLFVLFARHVILQGPDFESPKS